MLHFYFGFDPPGTGVCFADFGECRTFVHGHVVGLVALDQILWLLLRGANGVGLKFDGGDDPFLDRSSDMSCFRVPLHMISNFEFLFHHCDITAFFA